MPKALPIGSDNFHKIISKNLLYVDKTALISAVIEDPSEVILITRPRRWGKSLNISMLHHFFASEVFGNPTADLFAGLNISNSPEHMAHQGQNPTIYLNFKGLKAPSFDLFLKRFSAQIRDLYAEHKCIAADGSPLDDDEKARFNRLKSSHKAFDEAEIAESLKLLTKLLFKYYKKKTYILIDEYDAPLNFAFEIGSSPEKRDYFDRVALMMREFLGAALKSNPYLEKAVLTGILRISKDSMLSGLNNLEIYTVIDDSTYAPFFGFTDDELDLLFTDQNLVKNEPDTKAWYNGYQVNGLTLYNPWSIMKCLKNRGKLGSYWLNTGDDGTIQSLIMRAPIALKGIFTDLLAGNPRQVAVSATLRYDEMIDNTGALWNILISAGYLKVLASRQDGDTYECQVAIPNKEIAGIYRSTFKNWFDKMPSVESSIYRGFAQALNKNSPEELKLLIENVLQAVASYHDFTRAHESFFHTLMLALSLCALENYTIESNRESGLGRPDMVLIPKDPRQHNAFIFEFKRLYKGEVPSDVAKSALRQIKERRYAATLKQHLHIRTVSLLGMAFNTKTVTYHYDSIKVDNILIMPADMKPIRSPSPEFDTEAYDSSSDNSAPAKRHRPSSPTKDLFTTCHGFFDRWQGTDAALAKTLALSKAEFMKKNYRGFQAYTKTFGLELRDVLGDGNCLFHAVLDQLATRYPDVLTNVSKHLNNHPVSHIDLRKIAVGGIVYRAQNGQLADFMTDVDSYVEDMATNRTWADGVVIQTLASILDITIVLINSDLSAPTIIKGGDRGQIFLGYQVGVHFLSTRGEPSTALKTSLSALSRPPAMLNLSDALTAANMVVSAITQPPSAGAGAPSAASFLPPPPPATLSPSLAHDSTLKKPTPK